MGRGRTFLVAALVALAGAWSLAATVPVAAQQADALAAMKAKVEAAAQQMEADPQGSAEALDHLAVDSVELRKTRGLTPEEREVHRRLFLLRGRAHLQLMENAKAEESIRELLRVDPLFNAADLSPREQELFDGLRKRESSVLEVTSAEKSARVLVDGTEVGLTGDAPVRASIIAGSYELRLEKPGFKAAISRITLTAGQTLSVKDLVPVRNVPPIAFLADRDGVDVLADNISVGRTARLSELRSQISPEESAAIDKLVASLRLDPQTTSGVLVRQVAVDRAMTVRFKRDCFLEETRSVQLTTELLAKSEGGEAIISLGDQALLRMRPDVGTLRVASTPADADVFIDGQLVGRTPFDRDVCSGAHRIRVRHRIGSYNIATTITRGRTEAIDVALKPDLGFLGAADARGSAVPDLGTTVDRTLASVVTSFHLAGRIDLPPEIKPWTDASLADLLAAFDRNDREATSRLLRQAGANFDAPLLLAARKQPTAASADAIELLLFWTEHAVADRLAVAGSSEKLIAEALSGVNRPADAMDAVYHADLGITVAETSLPDAPLAVVRVRAGSPAAVAGVKVGDAITAADGAQVTAAQLADRIAQRRPGDLVVLRLVGANGASRDASIALQRVPRRAPAFDTLVPGNALIAKLTAKSLTATGAERDLVVFSLAASYMRFGLWKQAADLLGGLHAVPVGDEVGPGVAKYLLARCYEELGDRDRAMAIYKEIEAATDQSASDDGTSPGALARYRLALLTSAGT